MCLILFSWKKHENYKLILAANRDEFYNRPTLPASFWKENQNILAGKDLTGGGTWMGISKTGKIAMLTNYRDLTNLKPNAPSRGHLVSDYLTENTNSSTYLNLIASRDNEYNGYNIIVGDVDSLHYHSNYKSGREPISEGIHGLSNHLLNSPWPKVDTGKQQLSEIIANEKFNSNDLMEILFDDRIATDDLLPDTGVGIEKERMLSPLFIKSPVYGSRSSTVILVDWNNQVTFIERTYNLDNFSFEEVNFGFPIPK